VILQSCAKKSEGTKTTYKYMTNSIQVFTQFAKNHAG